MDFAPTTLNGAVLITPRVFTDKRGFFLESYSEREFAKQGITVHFVQDNHSRSTDAEVIRGLHFQLPPFAQTKLVRVIRGAVYDVIVDLRKGSPTYGKWEGFKLTAENFKLLYIPAGFAHGFCTIKAHTEFFYKVDNFYSPQHDTGLRWNDPSFRITWPAAAPLLSEKDKSLPLFRDFKSPFAYSA